MRLLLFALGSSTHIQAPPGTNASSWHAQEFYDLLGTEPEILMRTTTLAQRTALARLRRHLASDGYLIFTVSKYFRTSVYDFVAIHKQYLPNLLWVYPHKSRVVVRPFGVLANSAPARFTIEDLVFRHNDPIQIGPQITVSRRNLRPEHLVPPTQRKEFFALAG
jgi:hypothetical protein